MPSKKVGIIGSGPVGQKLAGAFSTLGYETKIGSRNPEKLKDYVAQSGGKISSGTFEQAAAFGDIVVLATHGEATENAIELVQRISPTSS
jgi:predicted dinucleotide-binding enzyme